MRSFDDERWTVEGPRWIAQLQLGSAACELGDAYAKRAEDWWAREGDGRPFHEVFRVLPAESRHVTLTLIDRPANEVSSEQVKLLEHAIAERIADTGPTSMRLGPALVNTFAIELYIEPSPALTALRERVAAAYRAIFPTEEPEPRHKPWRAHTAIGYCRADIHSLTLTSALLRTPGPIVDYQGPVTSPVTEVLLAATDPWSSTGQMWDEHTTHRIPITAAL